MKKIAFTNRVVSNLNKCISENGKVDLQKFIELTDIHFIELNILHLF
jgi:hypothetical protein